MRIRQTKILIAILLPVILGLFLLKGKDFMKNTVNNPNPERTTQISQTSPTDKPQIVSTKPDPLDNTIVPAAEPIEITFNIPLQNVPEFKLRIEPKAEFKVELSSDRKTAKIIFTRPLELGSVYTLSIAADTKFDQVGEWKESKEFHFRTINYRGI